MAARLSSSTVLVGILAWALGTPASAQVFPWITYEDPFSESVCDVVNTANAELVVIADADPGIDRFAIVTGSDVILQDTEVLPTGEVFYLGEPAGVIDFATDGDGLRSLWWLTLDGRVIEVETIGTPGEPLVTNTFPEDYSNVPCDACDFWDDQVICGGADSDGDGVRDNVDNCPGTSNPLQTDADDDGWGDLCDNCPQVPNPSQFDRDNDGFGDLCDQVDNRPVIELCGAGIPIGMITSFLGLGVLGLGGRRRMRPRS